MRAMDLLARREHSRVQLQRKLTEKGFAVAAVEQVLAQLATENLQSDHRYTENYVHARGQKGYGPLRIQMELREHGIPDELVAEYLDMKDPLWRQQAIAVRGKKFGEGLPAEYQAKAKQMRFLQYRGFTSEQIRYALEADPWD